MRWYFASLSLSGQDNLLQHFCSEMGWSMCCAMFWPFAPSSKKREVLPELAPLLWYSFGTWSEVVVRVVLVHTLICVANWFMLLCVDGLNCVSCVWLSVCSRDHGGSTSRDRCDISGDQSSDVNGGCGLQVSNATGRLPNSFMTDFESYVLPTHLYMFEQWRELNMF